MSTLRTNKGGIHIGTPWESFREYTLLTAPRMLTTNINQTEIAILEGDYYVSYTRDVVASSSSVYYRFVTPATKFFGFRFVGFSSTLGDSDVYFYKNATGITLSTAVSIRNANELINTAPLSTFHSVSSVTTEGDEYWYDQVPSGAGGRPPGGSIDADGFWIIAPSTTLLIKMTNNAVQSSTLRLLLEWFEITPEITA